MTLKQLWNWWDGFWFTPQSPAPICLYRIFVGLLVFICTILWSPDLLNWFGPRGICSIPTMRAYMDNRDRFSLLFVMQPTDSNVITLQVILMLAALFVILGLFTRVSLIVMFLTLLSFHHRNVAVLNSGDTFLRVSSFVLIFSPAGELFSVDRLIKKWRGLPVGSAIDANTNCGGLLPDFLCQNRWRYLVEWYCCLLCNEAGGI